ncbi:MAG TPA: acyltransferase [Spongiibacteraceae bacterium]|nr:acyltransferase [Spongiibacteraceae bacterium]
MANQENNKRIGDIEFLRGFGVLFIVHHHLYGVLITWPNQFEPIYHRFGFNFWLDVFFAISGFVISRDLVQKINSCQNQAEFAGVAARFWLRRIWRLLPTAWLWLLIIFTASIWFNQSGVFGSVKANFEASLAGVLQVANLRFADAWTKYEYGTSFHYWSLSLEEQFYMALPFVVWLARRRLVYVLAALVIGQFFINRTGSHHMLLYMLRTDSFALGILIALWTQHESYRWFEPRFLKNNRPAQLAIAVLWMLCMPIIDSRTLHTVFFSKGMVALLCGLVVLLTSYNRDYLWPDGYFKRFFVWIGARSYTLYVVHVPTYCLTREIWYRLEPPGTVFDSTYTVKMLVSAFLLLIVLTELNYRLIEGPLRRRGLQISNNVIKKHEVVA